MEEPGGAGEMVRSAMVGGSGAGWKLRGLQESCGMRTGRVRVGV